MSYKMQINSESGEYAESVNPAWIILIPAHWLGWFKKEPVSWGSSYKLRELHWLHAAAFPWLHVLIPGLFFLKKKKLGSPKG